MRFVRKINERGVMTLPSEVREALGVGRGDIVEFEVRGVVARATPTEDEPTRFAITTDLANDDTLPTGGVA